MSVYRQAARLYDAIYSFKDYPAEAARLHELIQERRPGAKTLLDVACGTGKHLEQLREWYDVEGLDLEPQFVEIARERLPGVTVHEGDMASFDLGRRFDAVTCLFSAIGHAHTTESLHAAVAAMARHLEPGGVLAVEPWFWPEQWISQRPHVMTIDEPDLKLVRMNTTWVEGRLAVMHMHHLVGRPEAVEHFVERIELALYTHEEYLEAFRAAGLQAEHDAEGLMGRGLYLGTRAS